MTEVWRPVPSKEGIMASSMGRIKFPEYEVDMPNGGKKLVKTKPILGSRTKSSKEASHVYMSVRNRSFGTMKVHRLVCEAFHGPPPHKKSVVIHLDEDGTNNKPTNLKWGTQKENLNMPKFIEYCRSRTGDNNPYKKGMAKRSKIT